MLVATHTLTKASYLFNVLTAVTDCVAKSITPAMLSMGWMNKTASAQEATTT